MPEAGAAQPFEVRLEESGADLIVRIAGELDMSTAPTLRAVFDGIERAPDQGETGRVVLDLSSVTFLDSRGIAVFADLAQRGRQLVLRRPRPNVRRALAIVGLEAMIDDAD